MVRIRESTRFDYPLGWYVSRLGFKDFHGSEMPFVFGNLNTAQAKSDLHPMSSRFLTTCKRIGARLLTVGLRLAPGCRCGSGSQGVLQFNATRSFLPRSTHEGDMMICDFWDTIRDKALVSRAASCI